MQQGFRASSVRLDVPNAWKRGRARSAGFPLQEMT